MGHGPLSSHQMKELLKCFMLLPLSDCTRCHAHPTTPTTTPTAPVTPSNRILTLRMFLPTKEEICSVKARDSWYKLLFMSRSWSSWGGGVWEMSLCVEDSPPTCWDQTRHIPRIPVYYHLRWAGFFFCDSVFRITSCVLTRQKESGFSLAQKGCWRAPGWSLRAGFVPTCLLWCRAQ